MTTTTLDLSRYAGHTEGEWKLRHTDPDGGYECARIVTVGPRSGRRVICVAVRTDADGLLIADAPALLDKLREAAELLKEIHEWTAYKETKWAKKTESLLATIKTGDTP